LLYIFSYYILDPIKLILSSRDFILEDILFKYFFSSSLNSSNSILEVQKDNKCVNNSFTSIKLVFINLILSSFNVIVAIFF